MARPRKEPAVAIAEIHKGRKQLLLRVPTFKKWYWFTHVGNNGEPIASGEMYTQKHNVTEVLRKYYPTFEVKDMTGE
jgi:hypothetical protein